MRRAEALADRLLPVAKYRFATRDVFVWRDEESLRFALWGDALRFESLLRASHNNVYDPRLQMGWLDYQIQKDLDVAKPYQTMSTGETYTCEVLEGLGQILVGQLGLRDDPSLYVRVTLLPLEGLPYGDDVTEYYSAKKKRRFPCTVPPWRFWVDTLDNKGWGADFCCFAPTVESEGRHLVGDLGDVTFLATHTLDTDAVRHVGAPAGIRHCGGLLYPSLAVSLVPATNYGWLVLVADASVVLATMKPYKKRERWPVVVYETDVWTPTTAALFGRHAMALYEQLTGTADFTYDNHMWILGPPAEERSDAVKNTRKLRSLLRRHARILGPELSRDDLESLRVQHFDTPLQYHYLEAKSNCILAPSVFPLAVCPQGQALAAEQFLRAAGFAHTEMLVLPDPVAGEGRDPRWDWAWTVREAVLERAGTRRVLKVETA